MSDPSNPHDTPSFWSTSKVRPADPLEIDHLARLWSDGWQDAHAAILPVELGRRRTLESFRDRLFDKVPQTRVTGPLGRPTGLCMVQENELDQLYVLAEERGSGTASALLSDAERRIAASGAVTAWLACAIGNNRAARFYGKDGWRLVGRMITKLATPEGIYPLEVWRYEKGLWSRG